MCCILFQYWSLKQILYILCCVDVFRFKRLYCSQLLVVNGWYVKIWSCDYHMNMSTGLNSSPKRKSGPIATRVVNYWNFWLHQMYILTYVSDTLSQNKCFVKPTLMSFVEAFLGELFWEVSNFDADTAICIHIYVYIGLLRTYPPREYGWTNWVACFFLLCIKSPI